MRLWKFNIDVANKWLTAVQSLVVIAGAITIVVVWIQFEQSQQVASFKLATQMQNQLNAPHFVSLQSTIDNGNQNTPIVRTADGGNGGGYSLATVYGYIGIYDTIGSLVREGPISKQDAYDTFGDDIVSAWCNNDIQRAVIAAQKSDTTATAKNDPYFSDFENLAKAFLQEDGQTCQQWESN